MGVFDNFKIRVKSFINPNYFYPVNGGYEIINEGTNKIGKRVDDSKLLTEGYVSNVHVYSIVRRIAEKGGNIPIDVYEGEKWVESGEAWGIIHPYNMSKEDFIEQSLTYLASTGNLYYYAPQVDTLNGKETVLDILCSGGVTINTNSYGDIKNYTYNDGFKTQEYQPEDIIHIKFCDPTVYGLTTKTGLSPLQVAYMTIAASNNSQIANANILENGGVKGILSSGGNGESLNKITETEAEELRKVTKSKFGGASKFQGIHVTRGNITYVPIGSNPADLQILDLNLVNLRDLCNVFGVPSQIFNDSANKTYSNQKAGEKALIENAVVPILSKIMREITRFMSNRGKNYSYFPNTNGMLVLQEEKKQEAEKDKIVSTEIRELSKAVKAGEMTRESAMSVLINIWELDEEEVKKLI